MMARNPPESTKKMTGYAVLQLLFRTSGCSPATRENSGDDEDDRNSRVCRFAGLVRIISTKSGCGGDRRKGAEQLSPLPCACVICDEEDEDEMKMR
ncbi:hypothetical protein QVD17_26651 [Tagetes erecta]|uniref:Uncharacterized protein n=1 Tax=Tagetes erecta TaxID=13708 RepID=A0AAD8KBF4_TARER|nr:hypothetical protein QVD17_26651 [Tagetes erecta]